jgi:hypothetical protein
MKEIITHLEIEDKESYKWLLSALSIVNGVWLVVVPQ